MITRLSGSDRPSPGTGRHTDGQTELRHQEADTELLDRGPHDEAHNQNYIKSTKQDKPVQVRLYHYPVFTCNKSVIISSVTQV